MTFPTEIKMFEETYRPYCKSGNVRTYTSTNNHVSISIRVDGDGKLEEKLDAVLGLNLLTTGWQRFENDRCRRSFMKIVNIATQTQTQYSGE